MANLPASSHTENALKPLFSEVSLLATRLRFAPAFSDEAGLAASASNVLRVLAESGPQTVPQIARVRGTSRQNIQILVNRLLEDGCVTLGGNPAHKRSGLVQLSAYGKTLFEEAVSKEKKFITSIAADILDADVIIANSLLREFRSRLERVENQIREPSPQPSNAEARPQTQVGKDRVVTATAATRPKSLTTEVSETDADAGDLPYNLL